MKKNISRSKKHISKTHKTFFLCFEVLRSHLFRKPKMMILFSEKEAWEAEITKGFKYTPHQVTFGQLSDENIKKYDLVVPLTVDDLKRFTEIPHLLENNPFPIPKRESIELCDDKYLFNQTMIKNGFSDYIPQMGGTLSYPYILKKRIDDWGKNCHIVSDKHQELAFSMLINHPDYFCQKLIPGAYEYATHILIKDKKIIHSINIEYVFKNEFPIKGKEKPLYTKICSCPYLELFCAILIAIDFQGLCCFNYKVIDNRPQIIEINPRFGGSLSVFFFSFIKHLV